MGTKEGLEVGGAATATVGSPLLAFFVIVIVER
jgi:hypothetical protein